MIHHTQSEHNQHNSIKTTLSSTVYPIGPWHIPWSLWIQGNKTLLSVLPHYIQRIHLTKWNIVSEEKSFYFVKLANPQKQYWLPLMLQIQTVILLKAERMGLARHAHQVECKDGKVPDSVSPTYVHAEICYSAGPPNATSHIKDVKPFINI